MWILWICIAGTTGACGVQREFAYATEALCKSALAAARVETGAKVNVARVTSIELTLQPPTTTQVTMLCRPK
jgi:hypothetical protein